MTKNTFDVLSLAALVAAVVLAFVVSPWSLLVWLLVWPVVAKVLKPHVKNGEDISTSWVKFTFHSNW